MYWKQQVPNGISFILNQGLVGGSLYRSRSVLPGTKGPGGPVIILKLYWPAGVLTTVMGKYVASEVVKLMIQNEVPVKGSRALMLGITFKENCPDIRNTKVTDIYHELKSFGMEVDIYDPWAKPEEVTHEYGITTLSKYPGNNGYKGHYTWLSPIRNL